MINNNELLKRIFIIGAGQLGSRHLQALKNIKLGLEINVIDPNLESLKIAKERYESIDGITSHKVFYHSSLSEVDSLGIIDIVIIASSSNVRFKITKQLLEKFNVKVIVFEKILFDKKKDYEVALTLLKNKGVIGYVNCCMRMMSFYKKIKADFINTKFKYLVSGSKFGLATNLPHYIDHMSFLSNDLNYKLNTSFLDKTIINSKRPGFYELTGTCHINFSQGSQGIFTCYSNGELPCVVEAFNEKIRFVSKESEGKVFVSSYDNNWHWNEIDFSIPFQSQLTVNLIDDILNNKSCDLPTFEDSVILHLPFLESLKEFVNENSKLDIDYYPFT